MRARLLPAAFGFLGVIVALLLWHLWQDHLLVDAIRQNSIQQLQQMQQQQQQRPTAPPVP